VDREILVRIELKQYENLDRAKRQIKSVERKKIKQRRRWNREQRNKRDREQKWRICASVYTTLKYKIDDIF